MPKPREIVFRSILWGSPEDRQATARANRIMREAEVRQGARELYFSISSLLASPAETEPSPPPTIPIGQA